MGSAHRAEYDGFAIWRPADHFRSHRIVSEASWHSSIHRHHVHFGAFVAPGEGDPLTVRRESGVIIEAATAGDALGCSPAERSEPKIAFRTEDDSVAMDVRRARHSWRGYLG